MKDERGAGGRWRGVHGEGSPAEKEVMLKIRNDREQESATEHIFIVVEATSTRADSPFVPSCGRLGLISIVGPSDGAKLSCMFIPLLF